MALAHRTSGHIPPPSTATTAAAATMIATSSPSPAWPPPSGPAADLWGPNSSFRACVSDLAAVLIFLVGFCSVGACLLYAARLLLRCLDGRRLRAAWEEAQAREREPKHRSDADDAFDGASSPVAAAGVWAEAECAICLAELEPEGGERVRVLPACGHGFHAACVEAWLATRASCPTCRAPSSSRSRPSRAARAP